MSQFLAKDWNQLWEIFHQIKEASDSERVEFFADLQKKDPSLCNEVQELLAASESSGEILENLIAEELEFLSQPEGIEPAVIEPGEILAERFRIIRELGSGGMGTVYEAVDEELGSAVALKMMRSDLALDFTARDRFHREINLARRITHPNACRIFDLFHHQQMLFLTMELLQGETLHQRIRRDGPMKSHDAMPIVLHVLDALSVIHSAGIVHRDLKSSNIILVLREGQTRAVVTDFGLAMPLPEKIAMQTTETGQVLGTPEFMAPEQLTRGKITPATDVYSLGLVLYEMVTGELPINEESSLAIAAKRLGEEAPSPRNKVPDLDKRWERIILRCLERNPKHRFQTAAEVVSALQGNPFFRVKNRIVVGSLMCLALIGLILGFLMHKKNAPPQQLKNENDIVVRRLWKGATGLPGGLLSTDGKILVDVDWETADLMTIDFASGEKNRITNSNVYFLPQNYSEYPLYTSLSDDGSRVAYSIKHVQDTGCDLRIMDIHNKTIHRLQSSKDNCLNPADWSSDNNQILVLNSKKDGSAEISIVSTKDGSVTTLKSLTSADLRKMCLSPDGSFVIYDFGQGDGSANHDVFLLSVANKTEKRIIQHKANDYVLGWSPDGTQAVFVSDRSGTYDAWSLPVLRGEAQGEMDLVRKDIGQIFPLKITREGSLYYAHMMTSKDLYTADLQRASSRLTKFPYGVVGSNRAPDFSSDGKYLYFQTSNDPIATRWDYDPPTVIKFLTLETKEEQDIQLELKSFALVTRVSRNGRMLLTTGNDGLNGNGLYKVDLDTAQSVSVVRDPENNFVRQFDWAPDGNKIFYLVNKGGEIISKELATGLETKVYSGASNFALSPDGKSLAIASSDIHKGNTSLSILNLDHGALRQILRLTMPEFIPALIWTPDGKSLIYAKGRRDLIDGPHEIWKFSVPDGKAYNLGMKCEYVNEIRVHPDNHRLVVSTQIDSSEVWMMENFLNSAGALSSQR